MTPTTRLVLALLVWQAADAAHAVPVTAPREPNQPRVRERSDGPQKSAAAFGLPEGFVAELFAAEPDVANPVAFSIDERGRVFVCETFRQNRGVTDNRNHDQAWKDADLQARTVADREAFHRRLLGPKATEYEAEDDRVRMLVDADGDGRADEVTVFADRFNRIVDGSMAGILARRGDVFITCIPALYRLRDADGDGRVGTGPPEREVLSTGYGVRVAYRGHDLHGLALGPDGRLYFTVGDRGYHVEHDDRVDTDPGAGAVFRCNLDGTGLEVVHHGLRNPQELAFDNLGNLFTVDNNSDGGDRARLVQIVPGGESGWNMAYQYLRDRGPWHREKLWHLQHEGQPAWIVPPLAHMTAGPCGFTAYPGTGLTPWFADRFFIVDFRGGPAGSTINTFRLRPEGASFAVADQDPTFKNILATDVEVGPDGDLWVADWVEGWTGSGKGRLWRFRPRDQDPTVVAEVRGLLAGDWTEIDRDRLVALLGHADRRLRLEAHWELARRDDAASLADVLASAAQPLLARVHAAWGIEQIARAGGTAAVAPLIAVGADAPWELRMVVARSLGEVPPDVPERAAARAGLADRLVDQHLHVRSAAAHALGRLGSREGDDPRVIEVLVALAAGPEPSDPHLRHAVAMGLAGAAKPHALAAFVTHDSSAVRLTACLALRRRADPHIALFLSDSSAPVALEAARAIHDLPIPAALPALAARAGDGPAADPFLRRAISAAERLGTPAGAAFVVAVLTRPDTSSELRQQALDALRNWKEPKPNNRVTNVWDPHTGERDPAHARIALQDALPSLIPAKDAVQGGPTLDEATRAALLETASTLGITEVRPLLVAWCLDPACSPASRARALDSLLAADDPGVLDVATRFTTEKHPILRTAARRVRVAKLPAAAVVPDLAAAAAAGGDVRERQAAVQLLGGLDHPAATQAVTDFVAALEADTLDAALELEVVEAAEKRLGPVRAEALAAARARGSDPLSAWRDVTAGGDPALGREVFFRNENASCVRCHKVDRTGGEVGPALDGIAAKRDRRHLLESIVHPDAHVEEAFRTTVIVTDAGKTVAGIVVSEDPTVVRLRGADGKIQAVPVATIEERASGPSAMPADLAAKISRRELRDLVEWLVTLKK